MTSKDRNKNTLLDCMLTDMEKAPAVYQPTNFWGSFLADLTTAVKTTPFAQFRQHDATCFGFVPSYSESEAVWHIDPYSDFRLFMAAETDAPPRLDNVSESTVGQPRNQYKFHGRRYSRSMLNYLRGLTYLKKLVDTSEIRRVVEIGGGYGTLGRFS